LGLEVSSAQRSDQLPHRHRANFAPSYGIATLTTLVVTVIALGFGLWGQTEVVSDASVPIRSFDLSKVEYQQLSDMGRRSESSNLSLDFLDRDHVLFTFNPKKLFTRHPDCPANHDDRIVHAAVFEASTGKILKQADWYLHDSRRYLWTLGSGKILLRKLNSLYLVDADLQEKPLWTSTKDLLWVSVTPDGKEIITETSSDDASASKGRRDSKPHFQITFRDAETLAVQHVIRSEKAANVESASSGFASVISGATGRVWLVRFGPDEKQRVNIARVRSRRAPDVLYLSNNTLLIGRDSSSKPGYSVSAFTVTGNRLWRQRWDAHRYYPILARSEDGSRFTISTFRLVDAPALASTEEQSDGQQDGLEQRIEVLDTASGTPVCSATAFPVLLNGQNFSLSPDGSRLAILRGMQIEFYDLPPMSAEEEAKYSAVKADLPGLYVPPVEKEESDRDAPAFTAADTEAVPEAKEVTPPVASAGPLSPVPSLPSSAVSQAPTATSPSGAAPSGSAVGGSMITLKSHAQVVALDVVVTDPKGHTVKGVPKQDFEVHEDGKQQAITYFDEVEAHPTPTVPPQSEVAPNIFANNSPTPQTDSATLILYDVLNTTADDQERARLELLKFLQSKPKGARFALCVLSNTLQLVQGFTPDEGLLVKAAKARPGLLRYTSLKNQEAQDQQTIAWLIQGAARSRSRDAATLQDMVGRFEQEASERRGHDLDTRAWITMEAFAQLARYLSPISGRKSLIWLSGSFPLGIFPGVDLRNSYSATASYADQIKQAVNLLAESHIAVYPVDVRGLSVYSMQTPTFTNAPDSTQPTANSQMPYSPGSDTQRFDELGNLNAVGDIGANLPGGDTPFMQEATEHGIMDRIASQTGGKAFYNTNGIEQAMAVAMEQETNYYALSYNPSNRKYDGKFRKIKVSLGPDEKRLHVIHRSGYFAVDPESGEYLKDAAKGFGLVAMQHGSPQAHQIFFVARVVPIGKPQKVSPTSAGIVLPVAKKKRHEQRSVPAEPVEMQRYIVDYAVAANQLHFDAKVPVTHHGVINFMITSFDENGNLRTSIVSRATSDLTPQSYSEIQAGGLRLRQQVDVPVQAASMRLGVQDALTGHMGTIEIPLPVKVPPGVEQSLAHKMPEIEPD
jgi:VWFA-related protein